MMENLSVMIKIFEKNILQAKNSCWIDTHWVNNFSTFHVIKNNRTPCVCHFTSSHNSQLHTASPMNMIFPEDNWNFRPEIRPSYQPLEQPSDQMHTYRYVKVFSANFSNVINWLGLNNQSATRKKILNLRRRILMSFWPIQVLSLIGSSSNLHLKRESFFRKCLQ